MTISLKENDMLSGSNVAVEVPIDLVGFYIRKRWLCRSCSVGGRLSIEEGLFSYDKLVSPFPWFQ